MHIPDGVLSVPVCAATGAISLGAVGYSLHKLKDSLADRTIPLTGMMSALVFAGQMVNFPIGLLGIPSVSGHLMGGVLAAAVLGPWAGFLAITLVLVVQCLLFSDGGMLALGANVLNMGGVGAIGGYAIYHVARRMLGNGNRATVAAAAIAAWLSVMAAAALFCAELRLSHSSGDYNFSNIFTMMIVVHSAIGVGEALITSGVIGFVLAQRPDLLYQPETQPGFAARFGRASVAGVMAALAVAAFMAPFASESPDGLNAVAEKTGFNEEEADANVLVLGDYEVPSPIPAWNEAPIWQKVSVSLAGMFGTLVVLAIALGLGKSLQRLAGPTDGR